MERTHSFILENKYLTRSTGDLHWETIEPAHIALWEKAQLILGEREFFHRDGVLQISIDLSPGIARLKKNHAIMREIYGVPGKPNTAAFTKFAINPVKFKVQLTTSISREKFGDYNASAHIISWLQDIFIVMNITAPGSFDLWNALLISQSTPDTTAIRLTNYPFDAAFDESLEGNGSKLNVLSLPDVLTWFSSVRNGFKQIPSNPAEKTIFALLHLSDDDISPTSVVWLFYALEALFDTKPGENIRTLRQRIGLLLELDDREEAALRKKLRNLYDLRSSFVHGGLEVVHPLHNDALDTCVNDVVSQYIKSTHFGVGLVVSCLQNVIGRGWLYPVFSELLDGQRAKS